MVEAVVLRLEIRGRVQGVGYRWAMVVQAGRLDVRGWVRNRRDGSVEAVVAGRPDAVEQLVAWARRGPGLAEVEELAVFPGEGRFETFEQRATV